MGTIKAKCIVSFKQFEGVLDKDDIVEVETIYTTEDEIISYKKEWNEKLQVWKTTDEPEMINPKGSFAGYQFKSKNGNTYGDKWVRGMVGFKTLSEIFEKI